MCTNPCRSKRRKCKKLRETMADLCEVTAMTYSETDSAQAKVEKVLLDEFNKFDVQFRRTLAEITCHQKNLKEGKLSFDLSLIHI